MKGFAARVSSATDPSPLLRCSRDCSLVLDGNREKEASVLDAFIGDFFFICFDGAEVLCNPCQGIFGVFMSVSVASGSCVPSSGRICWLLEPLDVFFPPDLATFFGGLESCCRLLFLIRPLVC
jgi:hypothetical protein